MIMDQRITKIYSSIEISKNSLNYINCELKKKTTLN